MGNLRADFRNVLSQIAGKKTWASGLVLGAFVGVAALAAAGFGVPGGLKQKAPSNDSVVQTDSAGKDEAGHISPLPVIEGVIRLRYADMRHISPDELGDLEQNADVVLLDVREPAEFAVSHLGNSKRVSPEATAEQVLSQAGDVQGKTVVVYCSVGARSSKLARRVAARLKQAGAEAVYNLSGGIFRWHNERRSLVDGAGQTTDAVHKFDDYWGKLLRRQEKAVLPLTGE